MPGLLVVALLTPVVLVLGPLAALGALLGHRGLSDSCYRGFARAAMRITGARLVAVEGAAGADWPSSMVIVCNHESLLDAPAVTAALASRSIRFVAKRELFWIPVFGQALWLTGNIPVIRHDTGRDRAALRRAVPPGRDVLFFAEGTRSRDGALHPFRKGAFHFAISHGLPILPVAACGGYEVHPPKTAWVRPGPVAVVVGEPVLPVPREDAAALAARVYAKVALLRGRALELAGLARG